MLGSVALDVLIGLATIFLVFSLVGSSIVEFIAGWRRWRAANLEQAIFNLLSLRDPSNKDATTFFNHPLIDALTSDDKPIPSQAGGKGRPAYIAPPMFADALIDLIVDPATSLSQRRTFWAIRQTIQTVRTGQSLGATQNKNFIDIAGNPELLQNLALFVDKTTAAVPDSTPDIANARYAFFHQQIESWYTQTMDRAAGWYKRRVQVWLFWIGLAFAVAINADTLSFAHYLFISPEARSTAVQLAENVVQQSQTQPAATIPALQQSKDDLEALSHVGIPLGWAHADPLYPKNFADWTFLNYLVKFFGLILTAFALCLGAPFWFDALNKLVNLRTSRPPDASSPKPDNDGGGGTPTSPSLNPIAPNLNAGAAATPAAPAPPAPILPPDYWSQSARAADFPKANLATPGYSHAKAALMARASLLAYSPLTTTVKLTVTNAAGWNVNSYDSFDNLGTQAFLITKSVGPDNIALLAFRGTEPKQLDDLIADAKISLIPCTAPTPGKAHCGFEDALKAVWDTVAPKLRALPPNTRLFITGHSLGAALATVAYSNVLADPALNKLTTEVYTFGSPRVGDPSFAQYLNAKLAIPAPITQSNYAAAFAFRFINEEDVVTRVAPREMGYDHVGIPMYLDANGILDVNFSEWLRFLNTVINAADNFRAESEDFIKHHSIERYVQKLDNLANM